MILAHSRVNRVCVVTAIYPTLEIFFYNENVTSLHHTCRGFAQNLFRFSSNTHPTPLVEGYCSVSLKIRRFNVVQQSRV